MQGSVLDTQMNLENNVYRVLKARGKPAVILSDRGTMDGSVYTSEEEFNRIMRERNTDRAHCEIIGTMPSFTWSRPPMGQSNFIPWRIMKCVPNLPKQPLKWIDVHKRRGSDTPIYMSWIIARILRGKWYVWRQCK